MAILTTFRLKEGDRLPIYSARATDSAGYVSLAGATGRLLVRAAGSTTVLVDGSVSIDADQVTNKGLHSYAWTDADVLALPAGSYELEVEFTFTASGKKHTFPNAETGDYVELLVVGDIG